MIRIKQISIILFLILILNIPIAFAGPLKDYSTIGHQTDALTEAAGFNTGSGTDLSVLIFSLIKAFLGLLGIIFIILVIWAGYNWMTAGGNEDKVSKAKTTLTRAIIGLVITVSAYAITYFIFGAIDKAT